MAAEVIPPQMSKVDDITTAINKKEIPIDLKIIFFNIASCIVLLQLNKGDPCVVLSFVAILVNS